MAVQHRDRRNASLTRQLHAPGAADAVAGVAAIFAFPLHVGAIRLGILDLYRASPGNLDTEQLADALAYADAAVVVLLHLQGQMQPGQGLHAQLGDPLDNRAEVHLATGVISVQAEVGLTEALLLLRAHAYAAERPIQLIAREVLAGTLTFHLKERDHERTATADPRHGVGQTGTGTMNTEQRLSRVFVELADTLVDEFDALDFLHTLTERSVELLHADAAGVILSDQHGHLQVVASTSNHPAPAAVAGALEALIEQSPDPHAQGLLAATAAAAGVVVAGGVRAKRSS